MRPEEQRRRRGHREGDQVRGWMQDPGPASDPQVPGASETWSQRLQEEAE